ncbi:Protein of unknown function [Epibacterium ulvae]|uniref:DUF4240 domain-containing protein n=1 Tax=Epibacterium ulvae TaxID=1156985 RepID=A0A1G5QQR1_9RHOB|nr:DUF4240 domain-containing protein [Epibacterium ulvae]SCZ63870.1 Protein of unknown function [Epibacterium ulvae]
MEPLADDKFWKSIGLIEGTGWSDAKTDLAPLVYFLSKQTDNTIFSFEEALSRKVHALDTRKHYRRMCGFFPGQADTFLYKRLAVVAQGERVFEAILTSPKRYMRWPTDWLEQLLYTAREAYELKHGTEMPFSATVSVESFENESGWRS